MNVDYELIAKIVSPILTALLIAWFKWHTEGRTKLIWYLVNSSAVTLPPAPPAPQPQGALPALPAQPGPGAHPPQAQHATSVHSHTIVVANTGKKTAHTVRISHGVPHLPAFAIYPQAQYTVETNPQGFSDILIPTLVPKEQLAITYLYFFPLTVNDVMGKVKCDEGLGKFVHVSPLPKPNKYVVAAAYALTFVGGAFLLYWALRWFVPWVVT